MRKYILSIMIFWQIVFIAGDILPEEVLMSYLSFEDISETEMESYLENFTSNPLIWQRCDAADLELLPLNDDLLERLIKLKSDTCVVHTWDDLQSFGKFTDDELCILRMFIQVGKNDVAGDISLTNFVAMKKEENIELSKNLLRGRIETSTGAYIGFVAERDQDERDLWDYQNLSICTDWWENRIRLGAAAFRFHWGQGLLFSSRSMSARSPSITGSVLGGTSRLGTYVGSDENRYLNGLNLNYQGRKLAVFAFYSHHKIDATIEDSRVRSFRSSGIHATESGRLAKDRLLEETFCTGAQYSNKLNQIGILFFRTEYPVPIIDFSNASYQSGISLFQRWTIGNWLVSGELAYLTSNECAIVQGVVYQNTSYKVGIQYRYFTDYFGTRMSSVMKEYSSCPGNESGLYFGVQLKLNRYYRAGAYVDFFSQNRSMVSGQAAEKGTATLVYLTRTWMGKHFVEIRYRSKKTGRSVPDNINKQQWSTSACYYLSQNLSLFFRGIAVKYIENQENISGAAASLAITKRATHAIKATIGTTHFYTPGAETQIYMYEPGTPFRFNLVSLSGTGFRWFSTVQKDFCETISATLTYKTQIRRRLSETNFSRSFIIEMQMLVDL